MSLAPALAAGCTVVLKDIRADAVEKGMAHVRAQVAERHRHLGTRLRAVHHHDAHALPALGALHRRVGDGTRELGGDVALHDDALRACRAYPCCHNH